MTAVIAAAGSGQRLGAGGPKALVPLAGRPMVEWSIAALRAAPSVTAVVVALPPAEASTTAAPWEGVRVVEGGAERADSVANALALVETELVAIHDAARPLATAGLVEAVVAALRSDPGADGAIAATPVADTIKRAEPGAPAARSIAETIDRDGLWAAQTPQVFRADALRRAIAADPERVASPTDEAMLVEAAGGRVLIHPSPEPNPKVTTPLDLRLAELLLEDA